MSTEYHKIQSLWQRDPDGTMVRGAYSMPEFDYLATLPWQFTEKVDGTNIRIMCCPQNEWRITYGGKTDNAQIPAKLYEVLTLLVTSGQFQEAFPDCLADIILYGEGYGAKIQAGGGNYSADPQFVLFDVKVGAWWLTRKNVEDVGEKLRLKVVPIIGTGTLLDLSARVRHGFQSTWGNFIAEGIVARPTVDLWNRRGERIITKLKTKDFKRMREAA